MARSAAAAGTTRVTLALVLALLLVASPQYAYALTCGQVLSFISQCVVYSRTGGAAPPEGCCSGVKGLNAAAQSTPDRKTACDCLKKAAAGISGIKPDVVAAIPGKCGVSIPYVISASTDCSKVH
ncbi:non-specific lipid-transfer protein 1-like [Typha angustifolia]|uniref:non-specific lipid-transfer protein 1-like n=1 Tax=Typha angustifolia TaxID=59011 RepID=UPI003C2BB9E3